MISKTRIHKKRNARVGDVKVGDFRGNAVMGEMPFVPPTSFVGKVFEDVWKCLEVLNSRETNSDSSPKSAKCFSISLRTSGRMRPSL